jgi:hypothetical protein
MKSVLRIERGPFILNNVFGCYDYDKIKRDLLRNEEKGYFVERSHEEDSGIAEHPKWQPKLKVEIQEKIVKYLETTNIPAKYGFTDGTDLKDSLSRSFVLMYRPQRSGSKKLAMSLHRDISMIPNVHTLSVVYTIKSPDCIGGTMEYSTRHDGTVLYSRDMAKLDSNDNSIYCFNGDFVAHCAYGVDAGVRFSVVMFFNTSQRKADVVSLWNRLDLYPAYKLCSNCYRIFHDKKKYKDHLNSICSVCNTCCNSRSSLLKHNCPVLILCNLQFAICDL